MLATTAVAAGLLAVTAGAAAPPPAAWPTRFQANITTNHTWRRAGAAGPGARRRPRDGLAVRGRMYYDWTGRRALRVDHGAGNFECVHFYNSGLPCTVLHLPDGMYRMLQSPLPPGQPACCLDLPHIGAPPPNWAAAADPVAAGDCVVPVTGQHAHCFEYPASGPCTQDRTSHNNSGCHSYAASGASPAMFTFPANDGLQDWYWIGGTTTFDNVSASLFSLPSGCAGTLCPKNLVGGQTQTPASAAFTTLSG